MTEDKQIVLATGAGPGIGRAIALSRSGDSGTPRCQAHPTGLRCDDHPQRTARHLDLGFLLAPRMLVHADPFIGPAAAHLPAAKQARWPLQPWWTTVGLPGLVVYGALAYFVVLLGALAWFLLLP